MTRYTGRAAIEIATINDLPLCKFADDVEGRRDDLTISEAEHIADQDVSLLYVDIDEAQPPEGAPIAPHDSDNCPGYESKEGA